MCIRDSKKSAVIIAALNEYLASHPELQSPCCKIEVKVGSNLNQAKMEQIIRTIVEEKMAMLQISGTATPKSEQVPEALEQGLRQRKKRRPYRNSRTNLYISLPYLLSCIFHPAAINNR